MKIVISSKCMLWNIDMPFVKEHLDDVIYVNHTWDVEKAEQIAPHQFNVEEDICCGAPVPGYNSSDYNMILDCVDDFLVFFEKGEDIIFLCDGNLASLYLFRAMYGRTEEYNIHLVFIHLEPGEEYNFFGNCVGDRRRRQNQLLFVKGLKSVASIKEGEETEMNVSAFLDTIVKQIYKMEVNDTYIFNHEEKCYKPSKITMNNIEESETKLHSDFNQIILTAVPLKNNDEFDFTSLNITRADGKMVCAVLKKMRKQLIEANDLDVTIDECNHRGECAGTCPMCELEMSMIDEQLSMILEEDRIYPEFNIEMEMAKVRGDL